ncbi:hypothetical protein [Paenibacillus thalictri]|uniref:DUF1232 domain-containing protein n=1 Tax=Paenibacillus thalictri TaxID=2527873 RepID=A0A4Q9DXU3_9BACL|nr:hypothetical protein [Paenibacillus thalictri]TBL81205.1 hypothetical protein EYB31_03695 [Paenibacillus thalictri]
MRKLLSLRHWSHIFKRVYKLIVSPHVPFAHKLLFIIPVLLYWVLPDVMPFTPIDDIAVTMLAAGWFAKWMEGKHGIS